MNESMNENRFVFGFLCILIFRQRLRMNPSLSVEELERRVLLEKMWSKYKHEQHLADIKMIDRIAYSQQKALDELRKESEELYLEAIQVIYTKK